MESDADDHYFLSSIHRQCSGRKLRYLPPASLLKRNVKKRLRFQPDAFHLLHKVPVGDGPYVKAKHVQIVDKNPERAIALFWAAINAGDRVDSALKDMAILMKQQNRSEEAIEAIKSLRSRCSDHAQEALDNILLDLFKRSGRLDDQIALLKHKLHLLHRGFAFHGRRTKTARSQGKKFQVSLEQEVTRLLGNLGWAYMQQANYVAAEAAYRKALSMEPDNNRICNLGICLMEQGRLKEAKVMLQNVTSACDDTNLCSESHMKSFERAQEVLVELEKCMQKGKNNASFGTADGMELSAPSQTLTVTQSQSVAHSASLEQESAIRENDFRYSDALLAMSGFDPAALIFTDDDRQNSDLRSPNDAENCSVRQIFHSSSGENLRSVVQSGNQDRSISVRQESKHIREQSHFLTDSWRDINVQGARSFVSSGRFDEFLSHCKTPTFTSSARGACSLPVINEGLHETSRPNMSQKKEQVDQDIDQLHGVNSRGSDLTICLGESAALKNPTRLSATRFRSFRREPKFVAASLWHYELHQEKWLRNKQPDNLPEDTKSTGAKCYNLTHFPMRSIPASNICVIGDERKQKDDYWRDTITSHNSNEDLDFTCLNDVARCVIPELQSDLETAAAEAAEEISLPKTPAAGASLLQGCGEEVGVVPHRRLQVFLQMTSPTGS
ncbi:hypothetical protein O6H91_23G053300 [Diphasiastrum complanatum]|uniref:Uncharacterized protein n=1 Tax=Diphasiastrum complanatum TaxID=34168 RepID=A0ACC2AAX4_DIPCM|nr:hypothetical protein O6H91_23G053300 [Diphasiastrum complanatum]